MSQEKKEEPVTRCANCSNLIYEASVTSCPLCWFQLDTKTWEESFFKWRFDAWGIIADNYAKVKKKARND